MKRREDFLEAIGPADPGFVANIQHTLADLQRKEDERPVKKASISFALIMAIVMIAAVAMAAARWGVFDFIASRGGEGKVLPEATELVQQDVAQQGGETASATFVLREAAFDGKALYMVVAVTPANGDTMLLGTDALPSDRMSNMGPRYEGETMTIAEYAAQNGRARLVHTNVASIPATDGEESLVNSLDYILEEDGTLVYMLTGACETQEDSLPVELVCITSPFEDGGISMDKVEKVSLTFTLRAARPDHAVASREPAIFSDCGVRVDRVILSGTAMSTHVRVEYTVVDEAAFDLTDDGLWFEFLDENGEVIEDGATGSGSVAPVGEGLVQESALIAMETLPGRITVRGYNAWEKNRYESHDFALYVEE